MLKFEFKYSFYIFVNYSSIQNDDPILLWLTYYTYGPRHIKRDLSDFLAKLS